MPRLSIITVNLNEAAGLRKTIESVRAQTFKDFEHIIIDGGSNDRSVDMIKEFASGLSYWISEPDSGIYDGMNKGTKIAKSEYCLYLNSGDCLYGKKTLENVFKEKFSEDFVFGSRLNIEENLEETYLVKQKGNLSGIKFCHSGGVLIKRSLLTKLNGYDEKFKMISDHHFFLRAIFFHNASCRHIPVTIGIFTKNGISNNPRYTELAKQERARVDNEIFQFFHFQMARLSLVTGGLSLIINKTNKVKLKNIDIDLKHKMKGKDVYVWGAGAHASKILGLLERKHIRIEAFLDSNTEYQAYTFAGYKIFEPEQILKQNKNIYIVVASKDYCQEIAKICRNYGLIENDDFWIPFE